MVQMRSGFHSKIFIWEALIPEARVTLGLGTQASIHGHTCSKDTNLMLTQSPKVQTMSRTWGLLRDILGFFSKNQKVYIYI